MALLATIKLQYQERIHLLIGILDLDDLTCKIFGHLPDRESNIVWATIIVYWN